MFAKTHPPQERTAADVGLSEHLLSLAGSFTGYLRARLELAGIEGKEALGAYGKVAAFLIGAIGLLLFGYVFLWIGIIAVIAHYSQVPWGWIVLAVGVLHLLGTIACLWGAKAKWGKPLFPATLNEFRKDQEWLSSPQQTASRS
ncbi:MAG: phage holin family protein [Verrucomicrobiota bacterium]